MEEVWKQITLSSLHDHSTTPSPTAATTASTGLASFQLQDFVPSTANPSNASSTSPNSSSRMIIGGNTDGDINTDMAAALKASPPTALRLNSSSGRMICHGVGPSVSFRPPLNSHNNDKNGYNTMSFGTFGTISGFTITCKRRVFENGNDCDDKRNKRLMKNRESAARSRARKQAHTDELEVEMIRLQKENAKLRRQIQQLLVAPAQLPKKHSLRRTLTAPL